MKVISLQNTLIQLQEILSISSLRKFLQCLIVITFSMSSSAIEIIDSEIDDTIKKLISPIFKAAGTDPNEIKFYILLDESINAFVSGGRNIFISTALISSFNDPDVLKGVIAHELGHIEGGHLVRRDEKIRQIQKQSMIAMGLLGAAAAMSGNSDAIIGGALGQSHLFSRDFLAYSRSQEVSADQAAVRFLHNSKNSVIGIVKLNEYFAQKQQEYKDLNPYATTHPLSESRLSSMNLALKDEPSSYKSSAAERKQYSRIVAKLRGFLNKSQVNDVIGVPLDDFAQKYQQAISFYEKHNTKSAITILDKLIHQEPNNGYLYELKGQILFRSGDVIGSANSYKQAIEYLSNPITKAEYAVSLANAVESYKSKSEREKVLQNIIQLLEEVLSSDLKSPYIYRILATAYGKLGDLGYTNLMLAEEALMQHRYDDANKFAHLAEKHSQNRARLKLKIDDIMREVRNITE